MFLFNSSFKYDIYDIYQKLDYLTLSIFLIKVLIKILEEKILIILICIWFLLHFSVASIDAFFCFLINLSLLYTIIILFKDLTSEKLGQFFRSNWSIRNIEKIFGSNKCTWMIPVSPKNLPKYDEIHI